MPANGETIAIGTTPSIPVDMSTLLFKRALNDCIGNHVSLSIPGNHFLSLP